MAFADTASAAAAKFSNLSIPRQIGLLFGLAASIAIGIAVAMWSRDPEYTPIYTQVSARDASEITTALERYNINFKIDQSTGMILVPYSQLQAARFKLAAEGLPRETNSTEQLFAGNNMFNTSQFMENARYVQALESELARTISKFNEIKAARVHLAIPRDSAFVRDSQQPSASVFVDVYPGIDIRKQTVAAIINLVASSIPNLSSSMVTVVDQGGQLLNEGGGQTLFSETDRFLDYRQTVEQQYAQKIQDILTPIFGFGRVKVKVSADIDFTSYEQTQELFNPELPALRSEQSMEEKRSAVNGASGVPGTLSNLPQPTSGGTTTQNRLATSNAQGAAQAVNTNDSRTQSTKNFELDKTVSHTKNQPGTIKRLTVAVLVDNKSVMDPKTKKMEKTPLAAKEIDQIKLLVTDAVGLDPKRGDSLNVINSDFVKPEPIEALPAQKFWQTDLFWSIVKQSSGALFLLFLLFGVLRPMLKTLASNKNTAAGSAGGGNNDGSTASSGSPNNPGASGVPPAVSRSYGGVPQGSLKDVTDYDTQINVLRDVVQQEPKQVVQVVKSWVD